MSDSYICARVQEDFDGNLFSDGDSILFGVTERLLALQLTENRPGCVVAVWRVDNVTSSTWSRKGLVDPKAALEWTKRHTPLYLLIRSDGELLYELSPGLEVSIRPLRKG